MRNSDMRAAMRNSDNFRAVDRESSCKSNSLYVRQPPRLSCHTNPVDMYIYLLNQLSLYYNSAAHLIPAGPGGRQKLLKEYGSAEFKKKRSALELAFMCSSPIALPRQLRGPGRVWRLGTA